MVQTRDGYLWLGTYSGLARFNGERFTVYNDSNTPEMRDSRVPVCLKPITVRCGSATKTVWCLGIKTGGSKHWTFRRPGKTAKYNHRNGYCRGLWPFNEEVCWRAEDGLVLTPQAGTAVKLVEMARSRSGTIWVLRNGRVSRLEHGQLTALPMDETFANNSVQGISASQDGGLWLVNEGHIRKWKENKWGGDLGPSPWGAILFLR